MVSKLLLNDLGPPSRVRPYLPVRRRLGFPGGPRRIPRPILNAFNQQVQDMVPGAPRRPRMVRPRVWINPRVRRNLFP